MRTWTGKAGGKGENAPALISQSSLERRHDGWHRTVLDELEDRLERSTEFPCLFARSAFKKKLLKFIFVDGLSDPDLSHLALGLSKYVNVSRSWNGSLNTAYPLIIAFSLQVIAAQSLQAYHAFGWEILQELHKRDHASWPAAVASDPHATSWSMCFDGMPLFCNMSCPAHKVRRSRNLGQHFLLVINPRERFDIVAGATAAGRKVRANIRRRIDQYDGARRCPQLGSFQDGGLEWWQYGLIEENGDRTDQCPFVFRKA